VRRRTMLGTLGASVLIAAAVLPAAPAGAAANAWTPVAVPDPTAQFASLQAVDALTNTDAWAVGYVSPPTGGGSQPIALHWNGTAWSATSVPLLGKSTTLWGVSAASASDVWAVGTFTLPGYRGASLAAALHWNGNTWIASTVPNSGILFGVVTITPTNAWAVGGGGVKHWDGIAWSDVTTPAPSPTSAGSLHAISARAWNDIWAVGSYAPRRHQTASFSLHFDGTAWSLVPMPAGSTIPWGVAASGSNDAWAVGEDDTVVGSTQPLTEHWNGTAWSIVPSPSRPNGGYLRSVSARGPNDVWAVGPSFTGDANSIQALFLHWTGNTWASELSPVADSDDVSAVSARAGVTSTWAVGDTQPGVELILERH
jgi:hypothetical protein